MAIATREGGSAQIQLTLAGKAMIEVDGRMVVLPSDIAQALGYINPFEQEQDPVTSTKSNAEARLAELAARREARNQGYGLWVRYVIEVGDHLQEVPLGPYPSEVGGGGINEQVSASVMFDTPVTFPGEQSGNGESRHVSRLGEIMTKLFSRGGILLRDPHEVAAMVEEHGGLAGGLTAVCLDPALHRRTRQLFMERQVPLEIAENLARAAQNIYLKWLRDNYLTRETDRG
ncbi:hypothetical protein A3I56_00845 [Candidatus Roizmanbacteria bacterium RIFCSPLOWO2_02_FULL_43_10]|uniref:Uncharacterized protein n=2 Tax=Candidatus Roizmaniibacteriota TaxID=1752723 RepID=A0A1F7K147_9BACT|nr:MAG: hypothetical protein A3D08_02235 [Candidatus Roizmanbacteria bacterium RIFCSPHIGHO2_02_FULL_43_11]OGK61562.1 MAG: hypothetical protein A3I56_00845 [Candidatus Roizmanbacteria bacterium RIFCSPLOWO2_02_FULL_43_10]